MDKKIEKPEVQKPASKIPNIISILEEKITREYEITLEELRKKTITIKNNEITIK